MQNNRCMPYVRTSLPAWLHWRFCARRTRFWGRRPGMVRRPPPLPCRGRRSQRWTGAVACPTEILATTTWRSSRNRIRSTSRIGPSSLRDSERVWLTLATNAFKIYIDDFNSDHQLLLIPLSSRKKIQFKLKYSQSRRYLWSGIGKNFGKNLVLFSPLGDWIYHDKKDDLYQLNCTPCWS